MVKLEWTLHLLYKYYSYLTGREFNDDINNAQAFCNHKIGILDNMLDVGLKQVQNSAVYIIYVDKYNR